MSPKPPDRWSGRKRQLLLLIIAAGIALLRFVGVPLYQQLQTAIDQYHLLHRNLASARQLIAQREGIAAEAVNADTALASSLRLAPQFETTEAFKLASQKKIEAVLTDTGVTLQNFDWLPEERLPDVPLYRCRAVVGLRGLVSQVALAQLKVQEAMPGSATRSLQYAISVAGSEPDDMDGVGRLFGQWVVEFWFRLAPVPVPGATTQPVPAT